MIDAELLGSLLGTALEAALAAGRLLLTERDKALLSIGTKRNLNDLVTAADTAAERLIVERIIYDRPRDGIIGEEGERRHPDAALQWVIDPLDGTTNYVHGSGPFAVSIGVELDGVPIVGVVHDPQRGETFSAAANCGAFMNNERLHVSAATDLKTSVLGFDSPTEYHRDMAMKLTKSDMRAARSIGSCAVAMSWVAAGRFDGFWVRNVGPWDISAGTIIVREAGGWVGGIAGGPPSTEETIAATPALADQIRALLS